ncbi:glycosyltransferase family 2 protein [Halomonas sp. CH40]
MSAKKAAKASQAQLHDVTRAPYVVSREGKPQAAVKVDQLKRRGGCYWVEGWIATYSDAPAIELHMDRGAVEASLTFHVREDVAISMQDSNPGLTSQGFCLEWFSEHDGNDTPLLVCHLQEKGAPVVFTLPALESFMASPDQDGVNIASSRPSARPGAAQHAQPDFLAAATWLAPDPLKAVAHLDDFGMIPHRSGLIAGWTVTQPGWQVWGVDSQGNGVNLENSLRYQREDIVSLFRDTFGQRTVDAGFVAPWPFALPVPSSLRLVAYHPQTQQAMTLAQCDADEVPADPEGYARWAFGVATPAEKINERFNGWEGELIETLLAERDQAFADNQKAPDIMTLGNPPAFPDVSLIIPLYSRWDFVEHQLLAFSQDAELLASTEIIYVVDDPRILTAISNEVENLHRLYNVPFKVVWGHRNRGFSGANNLGVSVSQGRQVLLLNSDAFPTSPGWVGQMSTLLDENPRYGLLGARLLNPEGGLQHAGMVFFYSQSWQVWLNKHPMAGLAPELDNVPEGVDIIDKPAVTGACVMMQRSLYDELGGLNEGYLIGDFEDSDLCLQVLNAGYQIGYVPGVSLVHLERQSFSSLGDTSFRTLVVRFNAWRHTKRWGEKIHSVMQSFS